VSDEQENGSAPAPALSVVVIGRNEGERLVHCFRSVRAMRPIDGEVEILYVDSASTDGSAARAAAAGATVLRLPPLHPSAALARNVGWRRASAPFVLFLDGDTIVHPGFVVAALPEFADERVAVVWGNRRELRPAASVYNRVLDVEWIQPPGSSAPSGGDALFRRAVLERTGGFDPGLIAG
jgi:glycosyltransferase involved in cell wall biosynthesis